MNTPEWMYWQKEYFTDCFYSVKFIFFRNSRAKIVCCCVSEQNFDTRNRSSRIMRIKKQYQQETDLYVEQAHKPGLLLQKNRPLIARLRDQSSPLSWKTCGKFRKPEAGQKRVGKRVPVCEPDCQGASSWLKETPSCTKLSMLRQQQRSTWLRQGRPEKRWGVVKHVPF